MPSSPRIRILSTGSEIMQGLYPDTNAQNLSKLLLDHGFNVVGHSAVGDDRLQIRRAIARDMDDCDLMIVTGGLGPTEDDVNRDVFAELWRQDLILDDTVIQMMLKRFSARGLSMPEGNKIQAMLPKGCTVLYNHWGTAPGFILPAGEGRPCLMALPGPPSEWRPMLERTLDRELAALFPDRPVKVVHTLHVAMVPESTINEALRDLFAGPGVELTLLAARACVRIRIVTTGATRDEAAARNAEWAELVRDRIGRGMIYLEGPAEATTALAIVTLLRERNETVALAESCTGGLVAKLITDVSGSSQAFVGGWVCYANERKMDDLGVPKALLDAHGAVSEETARALAEGARLRSRATYAISVTGIAGPDGGTDEKPVGLVWFALAGPSGTVALRRRFPASSREVVRDWAAVQACELLRRSIFGVDVETQVVGAMPSKAV